MVVFKGRVDPNVVRVPLRSEAELVASSGEYSNGISMLTHEEIVRYQVLESHLESSLEPVASFSAYDSTSQLRTYSLQRHVPFKQDLRIMYSWVRYEKATLDSLREMIDRIRTLIKTNGLIPDLAGKHNVVMNGDNRAKLIDINNIRPLLSRDAWSSHGDAELRANWHHVLNTGGVKRFINPAYLDDKNYPVADVSLLVMRNWEQILGKSAAELNADEYYGLISNDTPRERLLNFFLHSDL